MFKIKNVHEPVMEEDGFRILVDKSWPEKLSRKTANVNLWLKEIAPTKDIDEWVTEDVVDFNAFKKEYRQEFRNKKTLLAIVRNIEKENGTVTLLYSTNDPECNGAAVLRDKLMGYETVKRTVGRIHGG